MPLETILDWCFPKTQLEVAIMYASAKGKSQTIDVDTKLHGRLAGHCPLSLEMQANYMIRPLPPMAELLIFFILVLRGYLGWGKMQKTQAWQFYDMVVTTGGSTIRVLTQTCGIAALLEDNVFHITAEVALAKMFSFWLISWQLSLKLANQEDEEGRRHSLSLAPQGLEVVCVS